MNATTLPPRSALAGFAIALLAICLAGCSTRYDWSKPGATADQFDRDNRECAVAAAANPTDAAHGIVNEPRYRACLQSRQWIRTKEFAPGPPGSYRGFE